MDLVLEGMDGVVATLSGGPTMIGRRLVQRMDRVVGPGLVRHIQREKLDGQALHRRTGQGARSIFSRVVVVGDEATGAIELHVGANLAVAKYMRAQERGATITPKRGRFLTIPLDAAKTAAGVARFTARQVIENPAAHGYEDTFFHKNILFGVKARMRRAMVEGQRVAVRAGALGQIEPLFALKTSVTLKRVGYLSGTLAEKASWIREQLGDEARVAVRVLVKGQPVEGGRVDA
jgi:hypothetical protein